MSFCSPSAAKTYQRNHTCFSKAALVGMAEAWNKAHPGDPIRGARGVGKRELWQALDARLKGECGGKGREWCWPDKVGTLGGAAPTVHASLRPKQPKEWRSKPNTWLTNLDIDAVMRQYEQDRTYKYKYLGTVPVDFAARTMLGQCLYPDLCTLSVPKLARRHKHLGMVINLDKHDQGGSHWTSLFACIDPALPAFGCYFYDSVGRKPPSEVLAFMHELKRQAEGMPRASTAIFRVGRANTRHQFGSSECGLFSMAYQIRWITLMRDRPSTTTFEGVAKVRRSDAEMHQLRTVLFRPNSPGAQEK